MTTLQKIIKYGAIAFAIYLSVMIIGLIVFGITAIFGITTGIEALEESVSNSKNNEQSQIEHSIQEYSNIKKLEIDLDICNLQIKTGDTFKIETSNVSDKFECKVDGNNLKIKDNKLNLDFFNNLGVKPQVIIYMPKDFKLDEADIDLGINETQIEYLNAKKVDIEMGVGKIIIDNIIAEESEINGGAGEAIIKDSAIKKLDLSGGVGKLEMTSDVTEKAEVSSGVGKLELSLKGGKENYQIRAKKGLGSFEVDGKTVSSNQTLGAGARRINVEAGVGKTVINFVG